ncbi:MAG: DUF3577 domain-containing protein [Cellvibrionaceae bacterium]
MTKAAKSTASNTTQANSNGNVRAISNNNRNPARESSQWIRVNKVFGYLHEVRIIPNSRPQKLGVTISVPQGSDEHRKYIPYQLYVNAIDAHLLFLEHQTAIEDKERNVAVNFDVTNLAPDYYKVPEGPRKGEIVPCQTGSLKDINSMKIVDEVVYSKYQVNDASDNMSTESEKK